MGSWDEEDLFRAFFERGGGLMLLELFHSFSFTNMLFAWIWDFSVDVLGFARFQKAPWADSNFSL